MTSATEKLRRLLDERGVEWEAPNSACADLQTFFNVGRWYVTADSLWYDKERIGISMKDTLTPEQAIAATLWHGMLTAEQVREAINGHSLCYGEMGRYFHDASWQAIADKLNAELGSGTCRIEHRGMGYYCSECGEEVGSDDPESELYIYANAIELWSHCPRCGCEVVDA